MRTSTIPSSLKIDGLGKSGGLERPHRRDDLNFSVRQIGRALAALRGVTSGVTRLDGILWPNRIIVIGGSTNMPLGAKLHTAIIESLSRASTGAQRRISIPSTNTQKFGEPT
jgi:hypothetical protein